MTKEIKKEIKESKKEIKEEVKEVKLPDGVYEIERGYECSVNGETRQFIGSKMVSFSEAVKAYKLIKQF